MNVFCLMMECRNCDADMISGISATTTERDGIPVIPWDIAAAATFNCRNCGTRHDTSSDFDTVVVTEEATR